MYINANGVDRLKEDFPDDIIVTLEEKHTNRMQFVKGRHFDLEELR